MATSLSNKNRMYLTTASVLLVGVAAYGLGRVYPPMGPSAGTVAPAQRYVAAQVSDADVTLDDVRDLVAEAIPGSAWALADAVAERQAPAALRLLETLGETMPDPVVVVVLHRRIRELLELSDRLTSAKSLAAAAMAMGIRSEFRASRLAAQARRWRTSELIAAIDGLVELDAVVKGAPGRGGGDAHHRMAFTQLDQPPAVSPPRTKPAPGPRGRTRSRRRIGRRAGRAARSARDRCRADGSPRTARRGSRSRAARTDPTFGTSCRTGS